MTISSSLLVDRTAKVKHLDDTSRTKIKILTNDLNKLSLRKLTCSEGIHTDRSRMRNTDRIGKLDLTLVSKTCCNNVLCNITCSISSRTVNLCAVLTGKSTAAVTSCSAVGINDDLTTCQTTVTVRSADNKTTCRIDEILRIRINHISRNDRIKNILLNILMDLLLSNIRIMLCRAYNSIDSLRLAGLIILNSNLSLSIWS